MTVPQAPFKTSTTREAVHWLTLSMEGELSEEQAMKFQRWRAASPDNERAWRHIENLRDRLAGVEPKAGYRSLSQTPNRRRALKTLLVLGLLAGSARLAYRQSWHGGSRLIYSNGAHAARMIALTDATQLTLDADSEVEVRFTTEERSVRLLKGRVLIKTGHDPRRTFSIATPQGQVFALGTHFMVELQRGMTHVALYEGALRLDPSHAPSLQLKAGERTEFSTHTFSSIAWAVGEPAWSQGVLEADNMPLGAFIAELGRYRPGILHCSREVAALRISGVYPLANSDAVLEALTQSLPVRIERLSRYWVIVRAS